MALSNSIFNEEEQAQEAARLTAEIDRLDTEIASCFTNIGREYYEANPDDPMSDEMEEDYRKIDNCKAQIRDLTDEIRKLKGITTCEHCGADISVTDTFCSVCGARIISEITVSPNGGICPNCGHRVDPGKMFCSTCGVKINISESVSDDDILLEKTIVLDPIPERPEQEIEDEEIKIEEVTLEEILTEEEQETEEPAFAGIEAGVIQRFCMNCGAQIEPGDRFCLNCGQPIEK